MIHVADNVYALAYRRTGSGSSAFAGYVTTVEVSPNGQITDTAIDALEIPMVALQADGGYTPDIAHVDGDTYAVAYRD